MRIGYMKQEADLESSLTARESLLSVFGCRDLESIDADLESVAMEGDVGEELERLVNERQEAELQHEEVDDLIPRLGLSSLASTPIPELSGGWQMRVGLGQIMLRKPQLILLDEPTNHVDLETVEFMEAFLRSQDVPMVIVSHDRYFLNQVCTKIVEIYRGKTASYPGNYVSFLRRRDRQLAREWARYRQWQKDIDLMKKTITKMEGRYMIEAASKKKEELAELEERDVPKPLVSEVSNFSFPSAFAPGEGGIRPPEVVGDLAPLEADMLDESSDSSDEESDDELFDDDLNDEEPDWSQKVDDHEAEASDREPDSVVPSDPAGEDFWGDPPAEATGERGEGTAASVAQEAVRAPQEDFGEMLLEVQDCGVKYYDKVVLDSASLTVRRGEKVALVGSNGCGKSTLVRAIVGDLGDGSFVRGDFACTDKGMAYFPQRLAEAFNSEQQTVKDVLFMSCTVSDLERAGGIDSVLRSLLLTGVTANQPVCSLSGGEKARVAFAQFLLDPCALLVLDEPTNHLDIATRELLEDALKKFDGGALVVSHDRFFLREFATRVVEVQDDGTLREFDSWDAYSKAAPPQWAAATEAEADFIEQDGVAIQIWNKKKMSRVKRKYGNVSPAALVTRGRVGPGAATHPVVASRRQVDC
jgi:ATPase subunit of ABC transporter with duplicated ATPase domains